MTSYDDGVEKALKSSGYRFRSLFETSLDAIVIATPEGKPSAANPAAEKMFGMTQDEIISAGRSDLMVLDEKAKQEIKKATETGKGRAEFTYKRRDGSTFIGETTVSLFTDADGTIKTTIFIKDITERKKAEEALLRSDEMLKRSQEIAHLGSWVLDLKQNKLIWSDEVYKIFGLKPQEFGATYEAFLASVHPKDRQAVDEAYSNSVREEKDGYEIEHRVVRKDSGEIRFVHEKCVHVKERSGKIIRSIGMVHDITERKKNEEALRESEERFRVMADGTPSMLWVVDTEGKNTFVNKCFLEFFGVTFEQVVDRKWEMLLHPDDSASYIRAGNKALTKHTQLQAQTRVKRWDGKWRWIESNAAPRFSQDGTFLGHVGISTDITQLKQIEEKLRNNEERLNMAQEIGRIGSWEFHVKEGKALWSDELFRIFDLPLKTFGPDIQEYRDFIHCEDLERVAKIVEPFTFDGYLSQVVKFDYRIVLRDGSVRTLHTERVVIEVDQIGKPSVIMGIEQDITERKEIELQLERYSKNLEKVIQERTKQLKDAAHLATIGQTAGMVGHDIRNPLQAMTSDVYLLKDELASMPDCEECIRAPNCLGSGKKQGILESLGSLDDNISYINKIVVDLQDYARPLSPDYFTVDLSNVLVKVFENVKVPESVKLSIKVKNFKFRTDPMLLQRALSNIVTNAIQAMPKGGILEITGHPEEHTVVITVSDTGVGIPDEVKPKLFIPMMTTKSKGQGFGLAVSKRLIEAMTGTISFESEKGKGTKFIIELPIPVAGN